MVHQLSLWFLAIKNIEYVGACVNCYFIYVCFWIFMHIASRICYRFFIIVFINNYYIICENLPYIWKCKLFSAIVVYFAFSLWTTRNTYIYKYISHFILERGPHFVASWQIDGETYSQRGDFSLPHIFFLGPRSANACTRLQAVSSETPETPLIGCLSLVQLPILCLCLNLTTWLSRGRLGVTHMLDLTAPTRCHHPVY